MNKVFLSGRLTRDPEIKQASTTVCRFGLAVDRRKGEQPDFFNVTAFGKTGEAAAQYLKKGTKILLSGRVQIDQYTARNDTKKTATQIIVDEWEFAESRKQAEEPQTDNNGFMDIPEDGLGEELPFS